ncbi:MAG: hypothetical protein WCT52_01680 [Candidatus Micrarchaeia archaeon]
MQAHNRRILNEKFTGKVASRLGLSMEQEGRLNRKFYAYHDLVHPRLKKEPTAIDGWKFIASGMENHAPAQPHAENAQFEHLEKAKLELADELLAILKEAPARIKDTKLGIISATSGFSLAIIGLEDLLGKQAVRLKLDTAAIAPAAEKAEGLKKFFKGKTAKLTLGSLAAGVAAFGTGTVIAILQSIPEPVPAIMAAGYIALGAILSVLVAVRSKHIYHSSMFLAYNRQAKEAQEAQKQEGNTGSKN